MQKRIKRIAIIGDFLSSLGGTELYNTQLSILLKRSSVDVRFFVGERPKRKEWKEILYENNIPVIVNPFPQLKFGTRLSEKLFMRLVRLYFLIWQPEIIFTHPVGKMIISFFEQTNSNIPVIATEWTTPGKTSQHWYQPDLLENINKVTAIIATCEASVVGLRKFLKFEGKIVQIPHLVDYPQGNIKFDVENRYSIGCVTRLAVEKGLDFLISATSILVSKDNKYTLHIYGHGSEEKHLSELIKCFGLTKNVFFEGTFLPLKDLDRIARKHCLFVQPSLFESIPTSIVELMARNRVIVATRVGGIPEVINYKNYSTLVEPGDSVGLAKIICDLVNDKKKLIQLSRQSAEIYQNLYDMKTAYKKIFNLFQEVYNTCKHN